MYGIEAPYKYMRQMLEMFLWSTFSAGKHNNTTALAGSCHLFPIHHTLRQVFPMQTSLNSPKNPANKSWYYPHVINKAKRFREVKLYAWCHIGSTISKRVCLAGQGSLLTTTLCDCRGVLRRGPQGEVPSLWVPGAKLIHCQQTVSHLLSSHTSSLLSSVLCFILSLLLD